MQNLKEWAFLHQKMINFKIYTFVLFLKGANQYGYKRT